MNHTKVLNNYAEELASTYARYNGETYNLPINQLPEREQGELARLYLESIDRETTECVYGDDFTINSDYTCALLSLLRDDSQENRDKFAEVTRKNVLIYFNDSLQRVLDDACQEYLHTSNNDHGLYARQRPDNGEIYWSRT